MTRPYWRVVIPAAGIAGAILLMWHGLVTDPGPTGLPGDGPNVHNLPGDMSWNIALVLIEAAVALAIIRPWSYRRSWMRSLIATLIFAPWLFLHIALAIHSGNIMAAHLLWLMCLWLAFVIATLWSGFGSLFAWYTGKRAAPDV